MLVHQSLPYRFRESSFRRYEPHIAEVVASFPDPVTIDPSPLSPVTCSCRFRDAMRSLKKHCWETKIDFGQFDRIHPNVVVSEGEGKVLIGPKWVVGRNRVTNAGIILQSSETRKVKLLRMYQPEDCALKAACVLQWCGIIERIVLQWVRNN